jgi:hypothetical protein
MRVATATVTAIAAMIVAGPLGLLAYREGPVPAVTGGFGEPTCQKCHFDRALNDRQGSLRIEGVPGTYAAGQSYRLTVVVRRPLLARAGFEMSARFTSGQQAGDFRTLDGRLQTIMEAGKSVQYIQHTKTGSQSERPGEARWSLIWIAPPAAIGTVQFHIAANASNNDDSPLGDFIYAATRTIWPAVRRP